MISIVIPTYNESATIKSTLTTLYEATSPDDEVIVVDGLSEDNTKEIVKTFPQIKLFTSQRGRAAQMNLGRKKPKMNTSFFFMPTL